MGRWTLSSGLTPAPIVIVSVTGVLVPPPLAALRDEVIVPTEVGVPEINPVLVFIDSPVPARLVAA